MNARILRRLPGENCFGDHAFENARAHFALGSNRELLLETYLSKTLVVANSFFMHEPDKQVTFRRQGVQPLADISDRSQFAQLDYILVRREHLAKISNVYSAREEALASHHCSREAILEASIEQRPRQQMRRARHERTALDNNDVQKKFVSTFKAALLSSPPGVHSHNANELNICITEAFATAAGEVLPVMAVQAKSPWIRKPRST